MTSETLWEKSCSLSKKSGQNQENFGLNTRFGKDSTPESVGVTRCDILQLIELACAGLIFDTTPEAVGPRLGSRAEIQPDVAQQLPSGWARPTDR